MLGHNSPNPKRQVRLHMHLDQGIIFATEIVPQDKQQANERVGPWWDDATTGAFPDEAGRDLVESEAESRSSE